MSNCTRKHIVEQARAWIGLNEADGTHKQIVDIYNSHKPLARGYELQYTDPWCAGFASALAIICKATDIIPIEVSCNKMIEIANDMGIWVEADDYANILPGDFLVYDWQDTGSGDNTGTADHIGIVECVAGDTITVIEGNYQNAVGRRPMRKDGKFIRGFIVPHYHEQMPVETEEKQATAKCERCSLIAQIIKAIISFLKEVFKND